MLFVIHLICQYNSVSQRGKKYNQILFLSQQKARSLLGGKRPVAVFQQAVLFTLQKSGVPLF